MGMIGNYLRVSNDELNEYLSDSTKLEDRIYNDENTNDDNLIDVDKSWEGVFFLLTGKAMAEHEEAEIPLCWVLSAPNEIDADQDMGYGPATYTTIQQTKEVNTALNKLSVEELRARYNATKMMELGIYPECWDEKDTLEYLMQSIISLKNFYNQAVLDNHAVITFIN